MIITGRRARFPSVVPQLNGSDQYFICSNHSSFKFGTNPATILCWAYPTTFAHYNSIVGMWNDTIDMAWAVAINPSGQAYAVFSTTATYGGGGAAAVIGPVTSLNNWNSIVVVRDAVNNTIKIAVNGTAFVSAAFPGGTPVYNSAEPLLIGPGFEGRIGPIMIVNGSAYGTTERDWWHIGGFRHVADIIKRNDPYTVYVNSFDDTHADNDWLQEIGQTTTMVGTPAKARGYSFVSVPDYPSFGLGQAIKPSDYFSDGMPAPKFSVGGDSASGHNRVNQYFSIADSTDFAFGSGSATLSIWCYPTSFSFGDITLFSKWDWISGPTSLNLRVQGTSGIPTLLVSPTSNGTGAALVDGAPLTLNEWNLVVAVIDAVNSKLKISVNGGAFAEASYSSGMYTSNIPLYIGVQIANGGIHQPWGGYLAQPSIWKGFAASPTDVTWLFNNYNGREASEVVASLSASLVYLNELTGSPWSPTVGGTTTAFNTPSNRLGITGHKSFHAVGWIKTFSTPAAAKAILSITSGSNNGLELTLTSAGNLNFTVHDGLTLSPANEKAVTHNQWKFFSVAYDAVANKTLIAYGNTTHQEQTWVNGCYTPVIDFRLGKSASYDSPLYEIDSLAIRVDADRFTDSEISDFFNLGNGYSWETLPTALRNRCTSFYNCDEPLGSLVDRKQYADLQRYGSPVPIIGHVV